MPFDKLDDQEFNAIKEAIAQGDVKAFRQAWFKVGNVKIFEVNEFESTGLDEQSWNNQIGMQNNSPPSPYHLDGEAIAQASEVRQANAPDQPKRILNPGARHAVWTITPSRDLLSQKLQDPQVNVDGFFAAQLCELADKNPEQLPAMMWAIADLCPMDPAAFVNKNDAQVMQLKIEHMNKMFAEAVQYAENQSNPKLVKKIKGIQGFFSAQLKDIQKQNPSTQLPVIHKVAHSFPEFVQKRREDINAQQQALIKLVDWLQDEGHAMIDSKGNIQILEKGLRSSLKHGAIVELGKILNGVNYTKLIKPIPYATYNLDNISSQEKNIQELYGRVGQHMDAKMEASVTTHLGRTLKSMKEKVQHKWEDHQTIVGQPLAGGTKEMLEVWKHVSPHSADYNEKYNPTITYHHADPHKNIR